ncbi:unnamed protein product [Bemisia tabaci]|uniref:Farnesoic acid O-methyl transferase domain-containing protein n=1 Tax=Bemisia tabaci TaxID=7038 RepID=A0A9P0AQ57_BEMTA|nr:PREDICTED: uncharacterized protein LOC109038175 [Bemisia tabaci]CAH0395524.1 unnamed protein product [Bemisia tabaci]
MATHTPVNKPPFALSTYGHFSVPQSNASTPSPHQQSNSSNEGGDDDPLKKKKKLLKKKMIMSTTSQPPAKQLPAGNVVRKKKLKSSSNKPPKNEPREDGKRGKKVVHEQGREIIGNIIKFFEEEKQKKGLNVPLNQPLRRAAEATGISYSTIKRIKKEVQRCEATGTKLTTPGQFRRGRKSIYEIEQMKSWTSGWVFDPPVPFNSNGLRGFIYKEIQTDDKSIYQFHPISSGSLHFKVKTTNDAQVCLTTVPREGNPMYEVVIGGWANTKSCIRKNSSKVEQALVDTMDILTSDEYKGFWIRWAGGSIAVGREGESWPFMSWDDPDPFPVAYYGLSTNWSATGHWIVEGCVGEPSTSTTPTLALPQNLVAFPQHQPPAHAVASPGHPQPSPGHPQPSPGHPQPSPQNLATQHSATQSPQSLHTPTDGASLESESSWSQSRTTSLLTNVVEMVIEPTGWNVASSSMGSGRWVPASNGAIPPNAVKGGFDKIELYVGRAHHDGALIPGKIVPSHGMCYIAWRGVEHGKPDYDVLCDCTVSWIPASGGIIPEGALPAGTADTGETLFVGRTNHQGTTIVGMVQPSHKVCYIPYNGHELPYGDYEVMVVK